MKSSLEEFCFRLLPYYPLGIVTCVLFILILFIISSCRIYEKKKGQIFLIIGGSIKHEVHMMMPFYDRMMLRKRYIIETILYIQPVSDGMGREFTYLSSHAANRYFIPNWGVF